MNNISTNLSAEQHPCRPSETRPPPSSPSNYHLLSHPLWDFKLKLTKVSTELAGIITSISYTKYHLRKSQYSKGCISTLEYTFRVKLKQKRNTALLNEDHLYTNLSAEQNPCRSSETRPPPSGPSNYHLLSNPLWDFHLKLTKVSTDLAGIITSISYTKQHLRTNQYSQGCQ